LGLIWITEEEAVVVEAASYCQEWTATGSPLKYIKR